MKIINAFTANDLRNYNFKNNATIIFNSCDVFNNPFLGAIKDTNPKLLVGGKTHLTTGVPMFTSTLFENLVLDKNNIKKILY